MSYGDYYSGFVKQRQVFFVYNSKGYVITCSSLLAYYDDYAEVFDDIVQSFEIVSKIPTPVQNIPPTASISASPTTIFEGGSVSLNAFGSFDPDGRIISYEWNFGEGETGSGGITSHTYTSSGSYSLLLTVTDDKDATATSTIRITVKSEEPTPTTPPTKTPTPSPTPAKNKGSIDVSTNPSGAKVHLDGKYIGVTPVTIDVPFGSHTVKLTKGGYCDHEERVTVSSDDVTLTITKDLENVWWIDPRVIVSIIVTIFASIIGAYLFKNKPK